MAEGVASISDVQFPQFRSAPNFAHNKDVKNSKTLVGEPILGNLGSWTNPRWKPVEQSSGGMPNYTLDFIRIG